MSDGTQVVYTGTADFQEFSKADFAKAELDQGKLVFEKGVPKEVSPEVAEALTSKEGIFGDFSFESATEENTKTSSNTDAKNSGESSGDTSSQTDTGSVSISDTTEATTRGGTRAAGTPRT